MNDIMIDLETLDTRPSAIILSIGACLVNWQTGEPSDPFYAVIRKDTCVEAGLTESLGTTAWWDRQSPEAKAVFADPTAVSLQAALVGFHRYLSRFDLKKVKIWGNGSDFDNVILANAYDALTFDAPWRFYNNRCYRTLKDVFNGVIKEPERGGVYHNALDDAVHQARTMLSLRSTLGNL